MLAPLPAMPFAPRCVYVSAASFAAEYAIEPVFALPRDVSDANKAVCCASTPQRTACAAPMPRLMTPPNAETHDASAGGALIIADVAPRFAAALACFVTRMKSSCAAACRQRMLPALLPLHAVRLICGVRVRTLRRYLRDTPLRVPRRRAQRAADACAKISPLIAAFAMMMPPIFAAAAFAMPRWLFFRFSRLFRRRHFLSLMPPPAIFASFSRQPLRRLFFFHAFFR